MELDTLESFSYTLTCLDDIPDMCVLAVKQLCDTIRGQHVELRGDDQFVITRSLQCCCEIAEIVKNMIMYSEATGLHTLWHMSVDYNYHLHQNYYIVVLQLVFVQDLRQPEQTIQDILSALPFIQQTANNEIEKLKTGWSKSPTKYSDYSAVYRWEGRRRYENHNSVRPLYYILSSYLCVLGLWNDALTIYEKTAMCDLVTDELTIMLMVKEKYLKKVLSVAKDLNLES